LHLLFSNEGYLSTCFNLRL